MAEKDNWDRFEIISKFLGAVVLVAIPIIIKYSADNIAQSLERGKLVQTLIADLSQHSEQAKRDIALVALDAAVQQKESCRILWIWGCKKLEEDAVVDIATILIRDSLSRGSNIDMSQAEAEARTARTIIIRRANEKFYSDTLSNLASKAGLTSTQSLEQPPSQKEIEHKANASEILAKIQPPPEGKGADKILPGIRIAYVHYKSDKDQAEKVQNYLKGQGVLVPGIQHIQGISQNDIRYSNETDRQVAANLQAKLAKEQNLIFEQSIDLSRSGYKVPSGQFEIWLKD